MSNDQNVPKSWDQDSQDDYNQLPQQAANLNLNLPPPNGTAFNPQQQQYYAQPSYNTSNNANSYFNNYNNGQNAQYYQQPYQQGGYQGGYGQQAPYQQQYQNNGGRYNNNWRQGGSGNAGAAGLSVNASEFRPTFTPRQQATPVLPPSVPAAQRATTAASGAKILTIPSGEPKVTETIGGAKVLKIGGDPKPAADAKKTEAKVAAKPSAAADAAKKEEAASASRNDSESASSEAAVVPTESAAPVSSKVAAAKEAREAAKEEKEKDLRSIEVVDDSHKIDDETIEDLYGKEHLSVIFMGHVDAGKSTMGGNLLFLTGTVDKRTMEKFEKEAKDAGRESWYLSWVLDLTKEERSKGKTVEVGRGYFETEKRRYTILDAPGHKTYVPSMIGGASQADVGILVISARKGEYETGFERGGQTREHAVLAKNQGVNKLIIAVNKMDDPTVNWSKERYDECTGKLAAYLRSLGFKPKEDVIFMPVSAYSGANLKDRVSKDQCPWYDGPSLLEYLDNMPMSERKINAPFMMPIGAKYRDLGTMVEGKIESGHAKRGSQLLLMPNKVCISFNAILFRLKLIYCDN